MFATDVSYVGFILFFIDVLKWTNPDLCKTSIGGVITILYRVAFINNAVNPVIYFFAEDRFLSACFTVHLYKRCS